MPLIPPYVGSTYRVLADFGHDEPFSPRSSRALAGEVITFHKREYSFYDGIAVLWFTRADGTRVALILPDPTIDRPDEFARFLEPTIRR